MHRYEARLRWTGSTALGVEGYDRAHVATAQPAEQEVRLTTGEAHGDPRLLNPEQLVVMAASSCQLLWFLHLAAKARLGVIDYDDRADGEMPDDRLTRVTLRPRIVVDGDIPEERVRGLVEQAHDHCYVAKSLRSEVVVEPRIVSLTAPAEVVRLTIELNNSRDLPRVLTAADEELLAAVWHPECEFESVLAGVEGGTYRGFEGIRKYGEDLSATLSEWGSEILRLEQVAPDAVATLNAFRARAHGGVPTELTAATAWRLRDGKIVRARSYPTFEAGVAALSAGEL